MRKFAAICLLSVLTMWAAPVRSTRTLTWCAQDGQTFGLKDFPASTFVAYVGSKGDELRARYTDKDGEDADFLLFRGEKKLDEFRIGDLLNPNGWITRSEGNKRFAVAWSNGGAIGDWATRIFSFSSEGRLLESSDVLPLVEKDLLLIICCPTRGNNYMAVRWLDADRLLIDAEIHPTNDCGEQMGFSLGYSVNAASRVIERRLSYQEMINLPLVCTQNSTLRP